MKKTLITLLLVSSTIFAQDDTVIPGDVVTTDSTVKSDISLEILRTLK